ncbi:MAG: SDR family oxidoreductase [Rhizonema sp. PD37]|nr:SDR family oxidoreductase [Rhizonema sp. PD37]
MKMFEGKVVLITGGSSGIGRATAVVFAQEGAKVVVASRREDEGQQTVRLIEEAGSEGIFVKTDVSQAEQVKAMVEKTVATYGRIDCAFNNAGFDGKYAPLVEQTEESCDRILDINVKGVWLCMKYEIEHMLSSGRGAIVNTASIFANVGFPTGSIYAASKHAVMGLTRSAALEYAKSNIRINAVGPGDIQTEMVERGLASMPGGKQAYEATRVMGRLGHAEEVAKAVLFLCSDQASFTIGQMLMVDGGYTVQ